MLLTVLIFHTSDGSIDIETVRDASALLHQSGEDSTKTRCDGLAPAQARQKLTFISRTCQGTPSIPSASGGLRPPLGRYNPVHRKGSTFR
jgi:hypothetical protein